MTQEFSAPHVLEERPNSALFSGKPGDDDIGLYFNSVALYTSEPEEANVDEIQTGLESTYTPPRPRSQRSSPGETNPDIHPPDGNLYRLSQYDFPAAVGSGQNGSACSGYIDVVTKPTLTPRQPTKDIRDINSSNIIIFGETGVGKSSVINLIAGRELARTSNGALGCTFQHEQYNILLDGKPCTFWDTAGLEEGSEGRVPAALAEINLRELIQELTRAGGIHLVIYCIRAGRSTKALQRNYNLFYVTVCRKKVPVALVVTNLEHQPGGMETWWHENEGELRRSGMRFDAHACVTTLDDENHIIRQRRSDSQNRLRELVFEYSRVPPWKIKQRFVSWVLPIFHDVLRRTLSASRSGSSKTVRKVVICDMAEDSQPPSELCPGISAVWRRLDCLIGDKRYEFVRMDQRDLQTPAPASQHVGGVGAGLLVFYTSILVNTGISQKDVDALKTFYDIAGGQTCPVIVVVRGCDDEAVARMLWDDITSGYSDVQVHLTSFPSTVDGRSEAKVKLNELIEKLYVEHVEVVTPGFPKRLITAIMEGQFSNIPGFGRKEQNNNYLLPVREY